MKNRTERVQKIDKPYVSDDCIQVMVPYEKKITILNQDGILFHSQNGSNVYINKYLQDPRRMRFPYFNIPTHYSKIGNQKYSFTNQLLEYEKPYIYVRNGFLSESYAIKDNSQAFLIEKVLHSKGTTKYMTYDELLNFFMKSNENEHVYYVYIDGSIPNPNSFFPSKGQIHSYVQTIHTQIRTSLEKNVKYFREYQIDYPNDEVSIYLKNNPLFLNYVEASIKNTGFGHLNLSLLNFNIDIKSISNMLIVRINNGNITIQGVCVVFICENTFAVDIYDVPVTKFVLEQLKYVPKINVVREPRIPLKLNPGVSREDIKEAKQMVRSLKR